MKTYTKLFSVALLLMIMAQNSFGQVISEQRKVSGFKGISVWSGIDLYLKQGGTEGVTIEADKDKMERIVVEMKGDILEIHLSGNWNWSWKNSKPMKAYVTFKDLNSLTASGGSDVYSEGKLDLIKLNLKVSGGADAKLELDADELTCDASGGSDAVLKGTATVFKGSCSGGSDLKASDLKTNFCKVSASGGSDAHVNAVKEISISASGGSDVFHSGGARVVSSSSSGGSDIHKR
jgi:hypothetical protein